MKESNRFVYRCRWTGKHAFTLDVDLDELPMRRTDNARILDTTKYNMIKSALKKKQAVRIRRKVEDTESPSIELQHRHLLGKLPVAYTCEEKSKFLYIMDDAVEEGQEEVAAAAGIQPVPPCVVMLPEGSGVKFAVDDRGSRAGFIKIRTDDVMVQTTSSVANPKCNAELLDFLSQSLALRRSNLSVVQGVHQKHKMVLFPEMSREAVYNRMQDAIRRGFTVGADPGFNAAN